MGPGLDALWSGHPASTLKPASHYTRFSPRFDQCAVGCRVGSRAFSVSENLAPMSRVTQGIANRLKSRVNSTSHHMTVMCLAEIWP